MSSFFRSNPLFFWLLGGLLVVGGASGAWLYGQGEGPARQSAAVAENQEAENREAKAVEESAKQDSASGQQQEAAKPEEQQAAAQQEAAPRFDVLRVEKDGNAVIAGSGPPGSEMQIVANGQVVAKGKVGDGGDFAIVLDQPLPKGDYELKLRALTAEGKSMESGESGIVSIPQEGGELLAMVAKEGEASRIMQKPEGQSAGSEMKSEETQAAGAASQEAAPKKEEVAKAAEEPKQEELAAKADEAPKQQESAAKVEEAPKQEEAAKVEAAPKAEDAPKTEEVAKAEPQPEPKAESQPAPQAQPSIRQVQVDAVDVESGKVFVAGVGEPGRRVNIYLDNAYLGTVNIGAQGNFVLEAKGDLGPGTHQIRADQLAANGTDVANRAEVPLLHEVAEAPKAEEQPKQEQMAAKVEGAPKQVEMTAKVEEAPKQEETAAKTEEAPKQEQMAAKTEEAPKQEQMAAKTEEAPKQEETAVKSEEATVEERMAAKTEEAPKQEQMAAKTESGEAEPLRTNASVLIRRGDNLWRISRRMLGRGIQYTVIYEANKDQIRNPHWIYPGQVFTVPGADPQADSG